MIAVDRLDGVDGVDRGQNQVTRLSGGQGRGHRFQIAHFAQQNDIRILAHGVLQGLGVAEVSC